MLTEPQGRRSFLRSAGLIVATVAAVPYVRKFWPGWGDGLTRSYLTEREVVAVYGSEFAELNAAMKAIYADSITASLASDSSLLDFFDDRPHLRPRRWVELWTPSPPEVCRA